MPLPSASGLCCNSIATAAQQRPTQCMRSSHTVCLLLRLVSHNSQSQGHTCGQAPLINSFTTQHCTVCSTCCCTVPSTHQCQRHTPATDRFNPAQTKPSTQGLLTWPTPMRLAITVPRSPRNRCSTHTVFGPLNPIKSFVIGQEQLVQLLSSHAAESNNRGVGGHTRSHALRCLIWPQGPEGRNPAHCLRMLATRRPQEAEGMM